MMLGFGLLINVTVILLNYLKTQKNRCPKLGQYPKSGDSTVLLLIICERLHHIKKTFWMETEFMSL